MLRPVTPSPPGRDGTPDHIGIVERVESANVYTIEGNSSYKMSKQDYAMGVAWAVTIRGRRENIGRLSRFTTHLFALLPLRNGTPFSPPFGALTDYVAFVRAEGIVTTWRVCKPASRPAPPPPPSDASPELEPGISERWEVNNLSTPKRDRPPPETGIAMVE